MDHQLKLTARGHAVFELMADHGLSLDAACARVERDLETLRETLKQILSESTPADVTGALEVALSAVSVRVQSAYLEELERGSGAADSPSYDSLGSAAVH